MEFREDLLNWIYSGNERSAQSLALKQMTKQYVAYCNEALNGKWKNSSILDAVLTFGGALSYFAQSGQDKRYQPVLLCPL